MNVSAIKPNRNFIPTMQELDQLIVLCRTLASAPFYAKLGAGGVLAIWLTAKEMNLPPMMCLNGGLYNIEGKVTMSAQLMNMLIVNNNHRANILYLNDKGCRIQFIRCDRADNDNKSFEYEFNEADAIKAGYFGIQGTNGTWIKKPKDNWLHHPRDMYFARALSGGGKKHLPDVFMNVYAPGELEEVEVEVSNYPTNHLPVSTNLVEPPKEINSIDLKKLEDFIVKHELTPEQNSRKYQYVQATCEKAGLGFKECLLIAVDNEQTFEERFEKWNSKK